MQKINLNIQVNIGNKKEEKNFVDLIRAYPVVVSSVFIGLYQGYVDEGHCQYLACNPFTADSLHPKDEDLVQEEVSEDHAYYGTHIGVVELVGLLWGVYLEEVKVNQDVSGQIKI